MTTTLHDAPPQPPPVRPAFKTGELVEKVLRQDREVVALEEQFFADHAGRIVASCQDMARRFDVGGRQFSMGNGGSSCDPIHPSVELMNPIIEKRPALPTIALTTDLAILPAVGNDDDYSLTFTRQLRMLGKPGDMALGVSTSGKSCDHCVVVPSFGIQETYEALPHLLWDLIHVIRGEEDVL